MTSYDIKSGLQEVKEESDKVILASHLEHFFTSLKSSTWIIGKLKPTMDEQKTQSDLITTHKKARAIPSLLDVSFLLLTISPSLNPTTLRCAISYAESVGSLKTYQSCMDWLPNDMANLEY